MKKVLCIKDYKGAFAEISKDKEYEVLNETYFNYRIKDDFNRECLFSKDLFSIICDK